MRLPILIDNRLRRFGAAVIGYMGALAYGWAEAVRQSGWPDGSLNPNDWPLVLFLAAFGAVSGWLVIDLLGQPGWKGLIWDISVALIVLMLTLSVAVFWLFPPMALFSPLIVLSGLFHPLIGPITVIGGAVLLAYARLTAPKDARPPTSPRA